MNTLLNENSQTIKEEFEQFAKDKLSPISSALLHGKLEQSAFFKEMAQAGFLKLNVPAAYGGKDNPFLHMALIAEILANYDAGLSLTFAYHVAVIELLKTHGSDSQKQLYLPKLASGELLGTLAYLQFSSGEETKLVSQDNSLFLTGQKEFVVMANKSTGEDAHTQAANLVLVALDNDIILLDDLNKPSIKIEKQSMPMAFASTPFVKLSFANHSIMPADRLGSPSEEKLTYARNIIRTLFAATALGMSTTILNKAIDYSKTNERNGTPLAQAQSIQWKLADAATETSAARLLIYRAAWSKDESKDQFFQYATMAKTYATRVARIYAGEGLQIMLPVLQNLDSPLTSFYVDSKMLETFDATNEEEKILLSKLLGI